jgi:plastocyanin
MDIKTKIQIIISLVLVFFIGLLTYWIQLPVDDMKAQLITESPTVLVRIQDFSFVPDVVKIDNGTIVSWLNDETDANAGVQHTVVSYNPEDSTKSGEQFQSNLLSQGDTFTQSFTEEGVYYYNCSLHPFMTGKVCVGAASETADPDCVIETTQPEGTLGEGTTTTTTTTTAEESPPALTLPPTETLPGTAGTAAGIETAAGTGTGAGTEVLESGLPPLEETPILSINLQGAADEDYQPNASGQTAPTYTSSTAYPKTANSGPEELIYILLALVSLLGAKKYLSRQEN